MNRLKCQVGAVSIQGGCRFGNKAAGLCRHGIVESALGLGSFRKSLSHYQDRETADNVLGETENIFEVEANKIKFGYNALAELGK